MIEIIEDVMEPDEWADDALRLPRWEQTSSGWEAEFGAARLWVLERSGRYLSLVELDGTMYSEQGFGLRIWAMRRAEEMARIGGRGGAFP